MEIKQQEKTAGRILKRKMSKRIKPILVGLFVIIASVVLFFSVLGYGAYLNRIGTSTNYKHFLLRTSELDFSFVKNYAKGRFSSIDKMVFDIKFKHMIRLKYLRELAIINNGKYIYEESKEESFPAKLTYNGKAYNVKISLTGKMVDPHLQHPGHWSFQVKVTGNQTIDGMKRFGLLVPKSRGHLTDWLGLNLMKDRGLITLRSDFKDVSINGESVGVYYVEERFDKHLLENNRLREGIIFKIDAELNIYKKEKLMLEPDTRSQVILLQQLWQNVATGTIPANQFFDIEKFAQLFAIADLMNSRHPLLRENLRFYFNPVTGLAEPIAREFQNLKDSELSDMALFLEKPKSNNWHFWVKKDVILQKIFDNLEFKKYYIREAEIISQENFLDDFFKQHEDKINELLKGIYKDWSFYELPKYTLYENQDYIRSVLHSGIPGLSAHFVKKNDNQLFIEIANQQLLPLEISKLSWRDSINFHPEKEIILDSKTEDGAEKFTVYQFKIPKDIQWNDSLLPELNICYNYLGLEKSLKKALVFPWSYEERLSKNRNPIVRNGNYQSFSFIEENDSVISIPEGKWIISEDLIIPKARKFEIDAGAEIDLINQAKIISYSPIFTNGTKSKPVVIFSSDKTGQGLVIMKAVERSKLSHTIFNQISRPEEMGWRLSGAITFYESPVSINACHFSENIIGDDFLNIVRSDFSMTEAVFENIKADAFDCDFCTGTVSNTNFYQIGNDGIDVSGSTIEVQGVVMDGVGDKGLSAGENSHFEAKNVQIKNTEIAVTSKDQSTLIITDSTIQDCRIGMALFQKKPEFGPGFIKANKVHILAAEMDFLIEENSELVFDNKFMESNKVNVKKILYGAEYGKSSK